MSYEIPLPTPDQLQRKPITSSADLLKYLEERGFKPTAVVVDNANAKVLVLNTIKRIERNCSTLGVVPTSTSRIQSKELKVIVVAGAGKNCSIVVNTIKRIESPAMLVPVEDN